MGKNDNGNNGRTELVFVVDRSGSMGGLESDTIGGFNSMLSKQRTIAGECRVTTYCSIIESKPCIITSTSAK